MPRPWISLPITKNVYELLVKHIMHPTMYIDTPIIIEFWRPSLSDSGPKIICPKEKPINKHVIIQCN